MRYDVAQICENGHVINSWSITESEHNDLFCTKCGKPTITQCPNCNTPIRGNVIDDFPLLNFEAPKFCRNCGYPYPWTQLRLTAAIELTNELEDIDESDKAILITSINDLVEDTPSAPLAATRFRKIMIKVGTTTASMFRDILVDVLSETARKLIFP